LQANLAAPERNPPLKGNQRKKMKAFPFGIVCQIVFLTLFVVTRTRRIRNRREKKKAEGQSDWGKSRRKVDLEEEEVGPDKFAIDLFRARGGEGDKRDSALRGVV